MTDARTRAVQGRRRSNAAGPHGKGRREAPDLMTALRESIEEAREEMKARRRERHDRDHLDREIADRTG